MTMKKSILLAALAASMLAVVPTARSTPDVDKRSDVLLTEETNCFETLDRRPVLLEHVRSYLPSRYEPRVGITPPPPAWTGPADAKVVSVGFLDFVCESISVDGLPGRPTIVSIGTVLMFREGVPEEYFLWFATDNPLQFARLQQLGVDAHFIPRSTYSETTDAQGRRQIQVDYVGNGPGGIDHSRTITVLTTPTGEPRTDTSTFYHLGSKGEVRFDYELLLEPNGTANVSFEVGEESLPLHYGITSFEFPGIRTFFRGSWTGTIQLLG